MRVFREVGAGRALGIHWGTFQLTDEAREAPVEGLRAALARALIAPDRFRGGGAGRRPRLRPAPLIPWSNAVRQRRQPSPLDKDRAASPPSCVDGETPVSGGRRRCWQARSPRRRRRAPSPIPQARMPAATPRRRPCGRRAGEVGPGGDRLHRHRALGHGNNVLTGTLGSTNGYLLTPVTAGAPDQLFTVYLDAARTKPMSTTGATNFLNPRSSILLGLLGNSPSSIPLYVKIASTATAPAGAYNGVFTVAWAWKICSGGIWVGNGCTVGTLRQGSATATVRFTLTLAARPVTATISSVTTWDAVNGIGPTYDLPSSKRRVTVTLANPDIVPVDASSLVVTLPTPTRGAVALDGDGTLGAVVQTTPGVSGLSLGYAGPASTSDDVDFSSDGGGTSPTCPSPATPRPRMR
ncbi:spore coat protein U domain-containing protein [Sphingomonas sp. MMS24-JH45]